MALYELYVESGPKRKKTMVHVPELLGCIANGPTTEDALDAAPDAIRAFRRFLHRHGDPLDLNEPVEVRVVEHITEGGWLGNGSPYITFRHDLDPLADDEIERYLERFRWMCDELADWAETQSADQLDAEPPVRGRAARSILLHVLGAQGAYLASALGGAPGFSRLHSAAERGEVDLADALRRTATMVSDRIHAATPEERVAVRQLPAGARSLRKAFRRMLEHDWEHLAELSRRQGGPSL